MVGLGDLPGGPLDLSVANGVSADGSVVVGRVSPLTGSNAFVWSAATGMRNLQGLVISQGAALTGWGLTQATGVSADGLTIVGFGANPSGQGEAWLARLDSVGVVPEPPSLVLAGTAMVLGLGYVCPRGRQGRGG
jgi:uncharacterized membrane protein